MSAKLTNVTLDWLEGYSNRPSFRFKFDREVKTSEMLYRRNGSIVLGVDGEAANFHAITNSPREGGYGGSAFEFTVQNDDGSIERLENRGAWSSRAGVVNERFEQQVVGIGHIVATLEGLLRWVRANPHCGFGVAKVRHMGEIYYEPTVNGEVKKTNFSEVEVLEILA